ncbi:MAG: hypothetical protein M3211_03985 [Actinomycetota bacterium]|nr:hypothetical protein [Actinomycetota bacterium]
MSFDVALGAAVALLTVLVVALLRSQAESTRRIDVLERRLARERRRQERPTTPPSVPRTQGESAIMQASTHQHTAPTRSTDEYAGAPASTAGYAGAPVPEGDAVDIRGVTPTGEATTVALESSPVPTLLAFLSTSCGICTGLWQRLRDEGLGDVAPGVVPVVVTKDGAQEDHDRVRGLADGGALSVVLSGEAWDDYEVPGSPYLLLVAGDPGSVVAEGAVSQWEDLVSMVARAPTAS